MRSSAAVPRCDAFCTRSVSERRWLQWLRYPWELELCGMAAGFLLFNRTKKEGPKRTHVHPYPGLHPRQLTGHGFFNQHPLKWSSKWGDCWWSEVRPNSPTSQLVLRWHLVIKGKRRRQKPWKTEWQLRTGVGINIRNKDRKK